MPLPALAGLTWLASVIIGGVTTAFTLFTQFFLQRLANTAFAIALMVTLTAAFYVVILTAMQGIYVATPDYITQGMQLTLPSNFHNCLTAYLTVMTARWVYDWRTKIIQWRLF